MNGKPLQELPEVFGRFFSHAYNKGYSTLKQCVDVLGFLQEHSQNEVATAIELAMAYDTYHSDSVKNLLTQLKTDQPKVHKLSQFKRAECADVCVPEVDLHRYNTLANPEACYV